LAFTTPAIPQFIGVRFIDGNVVAPAREVYKRELPPVDFN